MTGSYDANYGTIYDHTHQLEVLLLKLIHTKLGFWYQYECMLQSLVLAIEHSYKMVLTFNNAPRKYNLHFSIFKYRALYWET